MNDGVLCLDGSTTYWGNSTTNLRTMRALPPDATLTGEDDPPWWKRVERAIWAIAELPEGWDSYGARPVARRNIRAALDLLRNVCRMTTPEPSIVPTTSGGLQVEWHLPQKELQVTVRSPDRFDVLFEDLVSDREEAMTITGDLSPLTDIVGRLSPGR